MKIEKTNPKHWLYLIIFTANILAGILCRWLAGAQEKHLVLYGHKLNGNLLALHRYLGKRKVDKYNVVYLVIDPVYGRQLKNAGVNVLSGLRLLDVVSVCRGVCIVSDHGPHALYFLQKLTSVKFVDVWHGIPFKGFDHSDFHWLHGYAATFVTSPSMKLMYENRYGFAPHQVKVTGYARTDGLINSGYDNHEIFCDLGIRKAYKKIVLFAPTWSHGDRTHSNIPFGMAPGVFFSRINEMAEQANYLIMFRAHLNSEDSNPQTLPNIRFVPLSVYADTEALLYISDVLVSDWSSIVFDFLVLRRPTIFIDTKAPFPKGFSYGPEYRFGPIVSDLQQLTETIVRSCEQPEEILRDYGGHMQRVATEVYNRYADGRAAERYVSEIDRLLADH